jgi:hypothetical protein
MQAVIFASIVGVVWGWAVVGIAVMPYALAVLLCTPFARSLSVAVMGLLVTLTPLVVVDRLFYGKWTVSIAVNPSHMQRHCQVHFSPSNGRAR